MKKPGILLASIPLLAALRVMMAPLPNIEPIMLFTIPAALVLGPFAGFSLAFGSMITADAMMGSFQATAYTALTYGAVGAICGLLGRMKRGWNRLELTTLSFAMILLYDLVTASFFAMQFMIPVPIALMNQIPFTILHSSGCVLVFLFAPSLMKAVKMMEEFSPSKLPGSLRLHLHRTD